MKRLILGSVVAAALVFTGCGSDDNNDTTTVDTENPVVKSSATAQAASTVELATDNVAVTEITLTGADAGNFTVNGATVTAPATAATYTLHVVAKDAAGNSGEGDVSVTVTSGGNGGGNPSGIVYNGLEWSPLIKKDDNETLSGRISQADARSKCTGAGKRLPTIAELKESALSLKADTAFRSDAGDNVVVWSGDVDLTGYYFNGTDANLSGDVDEYTDGSWTNETTNFYTCVKTAQ